MPGLPIIGGGDTVIPEADAGGVSLAALRRRLADEFGFWHLTTVTSQATTGEAARLVLSDDVRDDEAGYPWLGTPWVYAATGAQERTQRRVVEQGGYLGQYGALTVSRPFGGALAPSSVLDLTSPFPMKRSLGLKGYIDLDNEALARIWVEARIAILGNGTDSYSLADYPWLDRGDAQIRGVVDDVGFPTGTSPRQAPGAFRVVTDGTDRTLLVTGRYPASETFYLDVIVRADRLIYDGAGWGYATTPGLQNDSYRAAAPEDWVLAFAMVKACQQLDKVIRADRRMSAQERAAHLAENTERRLTWAAAAAHLKRTAFPQPYLRSSAPLVWAEAS
jgi:hypothetical protein